MYNGTVSVPHNKLQTFLKTAEALKIKGIVDTGPCDDSAGSDSGSASPAPPPPPRPRPRPAARPGAGAAQCPPAPPRGGPQPPGLGCQPAAAGGGRRRQRPWRSEPEPAQQQETQDGAA